MKKQNHAECDVCTKIALMLKQNIKLVKHVIIWECKSHDAVSQNFGTFFSLHKTRYNLFNLVPALIVFDDIWNI